METACAGVTFDLQAENNIPLLPYGEDRMRVRFSTVGAGNGNEVEFIVSNRSAGEKWEAAEFWGVYWDVPPVSGTAVLNSFGTPLRFTATAEKAPDRPWQQVILVRLSYFPNGAPPANITPGDQKVGGSSCGSSAGMARYTVDAKEVSLNVQDTPIGYSPPRGPAMNFTVTYNQRADPPPLAFNYSNLGPKWTTNWVSYVVEDAPDQRPSTKVFVPGGGAEAYSYQLPSTTSAPHPQSHAILVRLEAGSYERRLPDGSKQVYAKTDNGAGYPRKVFMTEWIDPTGSSATLRYDDNNSPFPLRLKGMIDDLGQETTLSYNEADDPYTANTIQIGDCPQSEGS